MIIGLGIQARLYQNMYSTKFVYRYYPWTDREYIRAQRTHDEDMGVDDLWNVMGDKVRYTFPMDRWD